MQKTHWTTREDEILTDLARKSKRLEHACQKASVVVNRSVNGCYQRLYTIRKNGIYDAICKRLDKRNAKPQPTSPSYVPPVEIIEAPQEVTTTPNKIEVDVKYMTISNGKLVIHL